MSSSSSPRRPDSRCGVAKVLFAAAIAGGLFPATATAASTATPGALADTEPRGAIPEIGPAPDLEYGGGQDVLAWRPEWGRVSTPEYLFAGALSAAIVAGYYGFPAPAPGLRGGILFDDGARDLFRASTEPARLRAQSLSDISQGILIGYPYLIDTALTAYAIHGSEDVAWQMLVIDTQSFLLTTALTLITKNLTSRERPYVAQCRDDPGARCGADTRNKSFISGHAAAAFTGAGLICAHHEALPLYGSAAADATACAAAAALATTTAVLRLASDEHYATDVIAASLIGAFSGYVIPKFAYYSDRPRELRSAPAGGDVRVAAIPELSADRLGLSILVVY